MKNKIIKLVEQGISVQTLSKMNENQINALYKRLISEQTAGLPSGVTTKNKPTTHVPQNILRAGVTVQGKTYKQDPTTGDLTIERDQELGEEKNKKVKGKNPWAICTATMGKEFGTTERSDWSKSQMEKYEKCVMGVKEKIKEGVDPQEYFLEEQLIAIVESQIFPKINKRDFLNKLYSNSITESEDTPVKTPSKPKTPTKPNKPDTPFKPKHKPKPKAERNESVSEAEETPVKAPPKPKTPVKPGKPDTPFKPKHKPKPKAEKSDIPSWFTWDELGINLK